MGNTTQWHGINHVWLEAIRYLGEVSVVLPAYNVGHTIRKVIETIVQILESIDLKNYEIVVVNDGSKDNTLQECLKAKIGLNGKLKIISYKKNRGKGFAVIIGITNATKQYIALLDADGDIDPKQLAYILAPLIKYDAVITSKWHPQSRTEASKLRKLLSYVFRALVWALLRLKLRDTQTGAKAFRRVAVIEAVKKLTVKRYAFDVELLTAITAKGHTILEVPSLWRIRLTSKFKIEEIIRMLLDLLAVGYRYKLKKQYRR